MTEENKLPALINDLSVATIEVNYKEMVVRSGRAEAALKNITAINTDEEDKAAEAMLVKVRNTYTKVKALREAITKPMDEMKKLLMEPEKTVTNDANSGNEYDRVKKLRDKYAASKVAAERARLAEIERVKNIDIEKVRVRNALKQSYTNGLSAAVVALNESLKKAFAAITLDGIDKLSAKISHDPKLDGKAWSSWFTPPAFDKNLISDSDVGAIVGEVCAEYGLEKAQAEYVKRSKETIDAWRDKLPELKKQLESNAEAAKEMAEQTAKEEAEKAAKAAAAAKEKAEAEAKAAELQQEFKSQIAMQTGEIETKGRVKKRAVIEAADSDIVAVISELFFNVFVHPKYPGIIKRDKKGVQQFNEDGTPVYIDWVESLLSFYAANCEEEIPGIKIVEDVVTTQRAAK